MSGHLVYFGMTKNATETQEDVKMRTKKEIKALDKSIETAYYRLASGLQINIMDIPKVFNESRRAIDNGAALDQAVRATVLMYCANEAR